MSAPKVYGQTKLSEQDSEIYDLIVKERIRQSSGIELIASENFTSRAVMSALGSCLTNKYSEGYPGKRYYGGTENIDAIEKLCIARALTAFRLNAKEWGCNVQPLSGSPANFGVFNAVLKPHDRLMGLDLPSGGHLTHGFYTAKTKVSATSIYWESLPYRVDPQTGLVDFVKLREQALLFRPKLIICGGSAYARDWDFAQFRKIADECEAMLLCDMAHFAGLVATQNHSDPFKYCDLVTTTTHKTLRGPRSGLIFYKLDERDFHGKISQSIFPSLNGGPHNHQIAAVAVQLKEVASQEFKDYSTQVVKNAKALGEFLKGYGYTLVTGGTDNHLLLWDLRPQKINGAKVQTICDLVHITLNKNSVPGDTSALVPGGVRVGAPAMTSRGLVESEFKTIAEMLDRVIKICTKIQDAALKANENGPDAGKCLQKHFDSSLHVAKDDIEKLKADVAEFGCKFPIPGRFAEETY